MPVTAQETRFTYTGNGVATTFAFGCRILAAAHMQVQVDGVVQASGYSVTGVNNPGGGNVVFTVPPANGASIILRRVMPLERATDYQANGDLLEATLDDDQDAQTMLLQQVDARVARSLRVPDSDALALVDLPTAANRAGKLLAFDGSGQPQAISSVLGTATQLALDLLSSIGSSLVGFLQSGLNAVARTLQAKLRDSAPIHVKDFGALCDGSTDDATAWTRAIAAAKLRGGARIIFDGVTCIGSRVTVDGDGITIEGPGPSYDPNAGLTTQARIKCTAAAAGITVFRTKGSSLRNVYIDGNNVATFPLILDRVQFSVWENVYVDNAVTVGIELTETSGVIDAANSYNTFKSFGASAPIAMRFNGTSLSGSWHNTFINTALAFTGAAGLDLIFGDNNTFIQTFIFRDGGAGPGVRFQNSATPPNQFYFFHLQASAGGVEYQVGVTNPGTIVCYDMSNAQPFPTVPSGCSADITTSGLNGPGWLVGRFYALVARVLGTHSAGWLFRDDNNLGIRLFNNVNGNAFHQKLNSVSRALEQYVNSGSGGDVLVAEHYANRSVFLRVANQSVPTFPNNDTTPSVSTSNHFVCNNSGLTTITYFDDGVAGQEITIVFANAQTTVQANANMKLAGGANFTPNADDSITLYLVGTTWIEKCRSINA
jgi:hypothetical protein